jgi:hypothetical protein
MQHDYECAENEEAEMHKGFLLRITRKTRTWLIGTNGKGSNS